MTDTQIWSWVVVVIGLAGFYFAGKKLWWAWYLNIGGQVLWFIYGLISHQPAFLVSAVLYAIVQSRNAYLWTKSAKTPKAQPKPFEYFKKEPIQAVQLVDIDEEFGISVATRGGESTLGPMWLAEAMKDGTIDVGIKKGEPVLHIKTLEGEHVIRLNMWIARGVAGELYGIQPDIFEKSYA